MFKLPLHSDRKYPPVNRCVYCGCKDDLTDEHIIPSGLGGRWLLPKASCRPCATITGAFEGVVLRTILGPLRMYYSMPTRRKKQRPEKLPLKVKLTPDSDFSFIDVAQEIYPFLILFPNLAMPDELTGDVTEGERGAKVKTLWIRAASFRDGIMPHLEKLARHLGVAYIEPQAHFIAPPFFRMLAKIAHAFVVAEMGVGAIQPFLLPIILREETSECVQFVGGIPGTEPAGQGLHELALIPHQGPSGNVVAVRIRLLALLETPVYFVAVGRQA
ncbi:hypothetical protein ACVWZ4_003835 [Bradyrhizobium sp. USDA 4472]